MPMIDVPKITCTASFSTIVEQMTELGMKL